MDDSRQDGAAALASAAGSLAERLVVAVEAARLGTWEWRAETGELLWDARAARIAGLPPAGDDEHLLGLDCLAALVLPEDIEQVRARLVRAARLATGDPGDGRFRVSCHIRRADDGALRLLRLEGRVLAGEDGLTDRLLGAVTDITDDEARDQERQRLLDEAVAARHIAEAAGGELELLLARMHDAVFGLDRDCRVTWVNDACVASFGLPRERLVGAIFWDLFPDGRGGHVHDELTAALATGEARSFEAYYERCDDTTLVRVYPTAEGLVVFSTNVTGARRALRALEEREQQLAVARHRLDALSSANVIGVAFGTHDRIDDANGLFLDLLGRTRQELEAGALKVSELTPSEYAELDALHWQELLEGGMTPPFEKEYVRPGGARVPVLVGATALDADRGEWMAFALDLTERRRAEDRLAALQRLSAGLARALTGRQIARATLQAGAAALGARAGTFNVLDAARHELELVQGFGYAPGALARGARVPLTQGTAEARACQGRAPVYATTREETLLLSPGYEDVVEQAGVAALATLPLVAGDRVLGAVTLAWEGPRGFSAADRDYLASIAELSAQALLRGLRYEVEHEIAVTLQRSIIPSTLPVLEGVELEAAYMPAGDGAAVGGDWYDVFPLGDDVVVLAIGDVAGKGVLAASAMAQFRNALRAYAVDGLGPSAVLERLNRLSTLMPDTPFATIQIAYLSRATGVVRYASAGHPPAAVRAATGAVAFVERGRGTPIGAGPGSIYDETAVQLRPGDTIVLYTDGLVERRTRSLDDGFAQLVGALSQPVPPGATTSTLVAHVLRRLVSSGRAEDDVAILSACYRPAAGG